VDTETYPVADELALGWYEGVGREASQERWAFAFSAKKDWRSKVRSDVEKIAKTNRSYKLVYFITNQFVKDSTRAEVEDALSREFSIDVRVLDRNWIVKCVFEHERLRLAIESLHIEGFGELSKRELGSQDTKRQAEMKELEERINDPERYKGVRYQLAEDCLQVALLARGLELSRMEIEARFERAEHVAMKVGHRQQMLRIAYNRAWTAYWWYGDIELFDNLYERVEELAVGSNQTTDIELMINLWQLLHVEVQRGRPGTSRRKLSKRTRTAKAELNRLAMSSQRPNNAHHARTIKLLMELAEALAKGRGVNGILTQLGSILKKSQGLAEYPVISTIHIIQELGMILASHAKYDELMEEVEEFIKRRTGDSVAGELHLTRGYQKLLAGKNYDAIRLLGKSQQELAVEEHMEEWIMSVAACGAAYERVGLLWAARSNLLIAINSSWSAYHKYGKLLPQTLALTQRIIWLELQLGRIPHVLEWIEVASLLAKSLLLNEEKQEKFINERTIQDQVLAIQFLRLSIWDSKWLNFLPSVLERAELSYSRMALLYVLGYEEYLRSENIISENDSPEEICDLFIRWRNQPASRDLLYQPDLLLSKKVTLRSNVLGCEVSIHAFNDHTSIYLAETILGALEALLATSLESVILPYRSELHISIEPSDFLAGLPKFETDETATGQTISIRHPRTLRRTNQDERGDFSAWLLDFLLHTTLQIGVVVDTDSFTERLAKSEHSIGRAMLITDIDIAVVNMIGSSPRFRLSDWKDDKSDIDYPMKRSLPWDHHLEAEGIDEREEWTLELGKGEIPESSFAIDNLKHKDRKIISLINIPLWDRAKWTAISFGFLPEDVLILGLGFENIEPAKHIFRKWIDRFGSVDEEDQLRISIIRGINRRKKANYRMMISTNLNAIRPSKGNQLHLVSRVHTMEPQNSDNLDGFLKNYKSVGRYVLLPAQYISETEFPDPDWDYAIGKHELIIRSAWEIGENDPDIAALQKGDLPIIPRNIKNPPIKRVLQRLSKT